ncbi:MAG TPA: hypothetical protein VHB50_17325 [Bryobacteraceae bacterium]|nr:hypothetical protein [Bryobacteraceae bacterium]
MAAVLSSMSEAEHVARHLENLGIPREDINIIAGNEANRHDEYMKEVKRESTTTGAAAASGASFGGGVGILAGLAALAIPGVGPIIAGGAMATVFTGMGIGAAAGGLVGVFKNMGISHDEAGLYEEAVRRGHIFVSAHVTDPMETEVRRIMEEHGARDVRADAEQWRASGWTHPNPSDSSIRAHEPPPMERVKPRAKSKAISVESAPRVVSFPYERPATTTAQEPRRVALKDDPIPDESTISPAASERFPKLSGPVHLSSDPAYIFGNRWASDPNYYGKGWTDVESNLRSNWEATGSGPWDVYRERIRRGYEGEEDTLAPADPNLSPGQRGY